MRTMRKKKSFFSRLLASLACTVLCVTPLAQCEGLLKCYDISQNAYKLSDLLKIVECLLEKIIFQMTVRLSFANCLITEYLKRNSAGRRRTHPNQSQEVEKNVIYLIFQYCLEPTYLLPFVVHEYKFYY